jgi:hypothetical protein
MHGYPGYPAPGFRRTGFRGWAVATVGGTILTGTTTTGQEWWEEWGLLNPDGLPVDPTRWCTCCHDARRAHHQAEAARREQRGLQLGLFTQPATRTGP